MNLEDQIVLALRRVTRAVALHSRALLRTSGLTGPQSLVLKAIGEKGSTSVGELARRVNLGQATMTDILLRLERKGLVTRIRAKEDRRRVMVDLTRDGKRLSKHTPPLLQEQFLRRLDALQPWEQTQLLYALQRLGSMMDAQDLEPVISEHEISEVAAIEHNAVV